MISVWDGDECIASSTVPEDVIKALFESCDPSRFAEITVMEMRNEKTVACKLVNSSLASILATHLEEVVDA